MPIDNVTRLAVYRAFGGKCFYSGRELSEDCFEVDHVVALANGGEDNICNYVLSDPSINRDKSDTKLDNEEIVLSLVRSVYAPKVKREIEKINKPKSMRGFRKNKDIYWRIIEVQELDRAFCLCRDPRETILISLPSIVGLKVGMAVSSVFGDECLSCVYDKIEELKYFYNKRGYSVTRQTPVLLSQKGGPITRQQASFILRGILDRSGLGSDIVWGSLLKHYRERVKYKNKK